MSEKNREELADALAALAAGNHALEHPGGHEQDFAAAHAAPVEETPPSTAPATVGSGNSPSAASPAGPDAAQVGWTAPASAADHSWVGQTPEDDDAVMAPAPPVEYLGKLSSHRRSVPLVQTLKFKQTTIPILLTTGVLLMLFASFKFLMPESAYGAAPTWVVALALSTGVILLGLGVMTMLSVRNTLNIQPPPPVTEPDCADLGGGVDSPCARS